MPEPGGQACGLPTPPAAPGPGWAWGGSWAPPHAGPLSPAEEPTFRCDACDELFPSKLDLRRHKKYACSSVGAALYEGLAEELKPEGLGGGGSDGQAHECKDCERMFPTKYRCSSTPPARLPHPPGASRTAGSVGPGSTGGTLRRAEVSLGPSSLPRLRNPRLHRAWRYAFGAGTRPNHLLLGTMQAHELAVGGHSSHPDPKGLAPGQSFPTHRESSRHPLEPLLQPPIMSPGLSCGDRLEGSQERRPGPQICKGQAPAPFPR